MRFKLPSWIWAATFLIATATLVRSLPVASLYHGYKTGRSSGALVFSIMQAIGSQTNHRPEERLSCRNSERPRLTERLRHLINTQLAELGLPLLRS